MRVLPLKFLHARIHVFAQKICGGGVQRLRVMGATPHWQTRTGTPVSGMTLASEHPVLPRMVITAPYSVLGAGSGADVPGLIPSG